MSFDWSRYNGNHKWLPKRTIFMCRHGSMAYGTNGPDSDEDIKGVFIAPAEYFLGFVNRIDQIDSGFDADACVYNLPRFLSLAIDSNPNMIELPFIDEKDWLFATPTWKSIVEHREHFLSQNAKYRFAGYAVSQLKRIELHRKYLLNPPTHKPTRSEYGLPDNSVIPKEQREALEAMMLKIIEGWKVDFACVDDATRIDLLNKEAAALADMKLAADDQYVAAANKLGLNENAIEYLKSERAYRAALTEYNQYETWKRERNPKRAALEAKFGYDSKHAAHLYRLLTMAKEILEGKGVIVRRPDADFIKSIRFDGVWTYEQLIDWAKKQEQELDELMKTTKLPKQPNRKLVDGLCQKIVEEFLHKDL